MFQTWSTYWRSDCGSIRPLIFITEGERREIQGTTIPPSYCDPGPRMFFCWFLVVNSKGLERGLYIQASVLGSVLEVLLALSERPDIHHCSVFSDHDPCMKPILEGYLVYLTENGARGNSQEHLTDGGENHGDDYYPDIEGKTISIHCLRINASEYFLSVRCVIANVF